MLRGQGSSTTAAIQIILQGVTGKLWSSSCKLQKVITSLCVLRSAFLPAEPLPASQPFGPASRLLPTSARSSQRTPQNYGGRRRSPECRNRWSPYGFGLGLEQVTMHRKAWYQQRLHLWHLPDDFLDLRDSRIAAEPESVIASLVLICACLLVTMAVIHPSLELSAFAGLRRLDSLDLRLCGASPASGKLFAWGNLQVGGICFILLEL